jgi:hypothetical protein
VTCTTCGATLPDMRVPYPGFPPCDCCRTEGLGYLYGMDSGGRSFCGECFHNGASRIPAAQQTREGSEPGK